MVLNVHVTVLSDRCQCYSMVLTTP